jgi:DNA-binding XRE family transcriptional regulator
MTFAEKLQELRIKAGMTQAALAEVSGLPIWTIRNYEQGRREPNWKAALALAKAVGVAVEAFSDCISVASEGETPAKQSGRPSKATPATPPAGALEQEGKKRHQEGPRPPRARKGK